MVGRPEKIVAAALIGLLYAGGARAEAPSPAPAAASPGKPADGTPELLPAVKEGKGAVRFGEVRITGSPEHPGVLFFLPRTRFHLLPPRRQPDWREELLRDDREKGALAP